jgi:mono/diheme cytochrome c family protein
MNKKYQVLGLSILVNGWILGAAWGADSAMEAGAKIYTAKCVACHAKDGTGNPAMATDFHLPDPAVLNLVSKAAQKHTDAELSKAISNGLNKMPAFKGNLTDTEISEVVAHIRSLAKK